ncbi:hypothetical protein ENSA5_01380 [Enhygromyxa salina]|uniref:Uncharacterized protein n=2 Tax=Enhygromyxa salina TaxID=215803 RepID=A0A2S9YL75_9BACT|nr:hypothetical protein ENSA5_01380 [Enhygromyxa salina]
MVLAGAMTVGACAEDIEYRPPMCSDREPEVDLPDLPLVDSTENLEIHADEGLLLCAGTIELYETTYRHNNAVLGLEDPHDVRLFYTNSVAEYCPENASACNLRDGTAIAGPGWVFHELGHASNCEWRVSSAPALNEGLATSFEPVAQDHMTDPREFITAESPFDVHYESAAHFVRWLIEERGLEPFRELFLLAPHSGGDGVLEAIEDVYGQDADALFDEYLEAAPYLWVPYRQCTDLEVLEPNGDTWEFNSIFDCSDPATLGPYERQENINWDQLAKTAMYQSFLIEIETPGVYRFERDEPETSIEIERCVDQVSLSKQEAEEQWIDTGLFPTLQGTTDIELPAGTYRVDVRREYTKPHPVWVRISPNPDGN